MADKAMDNNQVTIVGTVDSEFTYSHEVFGEGFYMLEVVVNRLSHMEDRIPLWVSERLVGMIWRATGGRSWKYTDSSVLIISMKKAEIV